MVNRLIEQGSAELVPGVLFIDEVHMLDIECFTFLHKAMESAVSPVIIFASNRGMCNITGTDLLAPHGIPIDLLDRLTIVTTRPYSKEEMRKIIAVRSNTEEINISEEILEMLAEVAEKRSLRYALQLLLPCSILASSCGLEREITKQDVTDCMELFFDCQESSKLLQTKS